MFYLTNISRFFLSRTINSLNLRNVQKYMLMRRSFILLLAASMFILTGCDFFRTLAGRPTSAEIEARRIEIMRAEESALQARLDSMKLAQQTMKDSLAALDSIRQYGGTILNPSKLGGLFATKLDARYYVIVGSFRSRSNAESLLVKAADRGYAPALISFRNGMIAVGLCPVNKLHDAMEALKSVKKEAFCPSDVWILLNE